MQSQAQLAQMLHQQQQPDSALQSNQVQNRLDQLFPPLSGQLGLGTGINLQDPHLLHSVEARIREHEAVEMSRHRKAAKIHRMAKYNNVMTQGDKDFITRIQVSQLVNTAGPKGEYDPYIDDFYFVVMQSLKASRVQQAQAQAHGGTRPGPDGAVPSQIIQNNRQRQQIKNSQMGDKRMTRRENAMNRMAQQVQRLVDDAKKKPRATQCDHISLLSLKIRKLIRLADSPVSLEGALGKIAIRTRSAPRPLLQVESKSDLPSPATFPASNSLSSSLNQSSTATTGAALDRRNVLVALEEVYDIVLKLEQSRRLQPALLSAAQTEQRAQESQNVPGILTMHPVGTEARYALEEHEVRYNELVERMWKGMKIMEPLDISSPHPFISLLGPSKGKKLLPRVLRHMNQQQTLTLLTLLVATFDTLDVVKDASMLDTNPNDPMLSMGVHSIVSSAAQTRTRKQLELETETLLNVTIPLVMSTVGRLQLRIVTGMLGLMIERNDLIKLAKSKVSLGRNRCPILYLSPSRND